MELKQTSLKPFSNAKPGLKIQTNVVNKSRVDWRKPTGNAPWEDINSAPGTKKEYGDADRHALTRAMASNNWRDKAPAIQTIPEHSTEGGFNGADHDKPALKVEVSVAQPRNKTFEKIFSEKDYKKLGVGVTCQESCEIAVCDYGVANIDDQLKLNPAPAKGVIQGLTVFELGGPSGYRRPIAEVEQVGNGDGTRPRSFDDLDMDEKKWLKRLTEFGLAGEVVEDFFGSVDSAAVPMNVVEDEKRMKPPARDEALKKFQDALEAVGVRYSREPEILTQDSTFAGIETGSAEGSEEEMKALDPSIVAICTERGGSLSSRLNRQPVQDIEQQGINIIEHVRSLVSQNQNRQFQMTNGSGHTVLATNGCVTSTSAHMPDGPGSGYHVSARNALNPRACEFKPDKAFRSPVEMSAEKKQRSLAPTDDLSSCWLLVDRDNLSECTSVFEEPTSASTKGAENSPTKANGYQSTSRTRTTRFSNSQNTHPQFFPRSPRRACLTVPISSKKGVSSLGPLPEVEKLMSGSVFQNGVQTQQAALGSAPLTFGAGPLPLAPGLALPGGVRPLILTPIQVQGAGPLPPLFQVQSPPVSSAPSMGSGINMPPMPVKKPKIPNAAQQQAYEAYIEWRKANQPGYAEECKVRQARRVMRAMEREKNGFENRKPGAVAVSGEKQVTAN